MSTQPEALRLADWLISVGGGPLAKDAAAELRRLHAENEVMVELVKELVDQRSPLSDGWILGMWPDTGFPLQVLKFARAIEAAHGIGGKT